MNCIIVDDEPLARKAIQKLVYQTENLESIASFSGPDATREFLAKNVVDLIFLDFEAQKQIRRIRVAGSAQRMTYTFSPDGKYFAYGTQNSNEINLFGIRCPWEN